MACLSTKGKKRQGHQCLCWHRANAPFDLPTRCAVQQSSCVVVCGSVGNSAVSVSGGAAALPAQAPPNALCDLTVRSAVHGWIAAALRTAVWASTLRINLRTHACMRYHASAHLASLTNKDVSHTKLRCRATWTGHLTCSRRLSACAAIGRTTGRGRRIQQAHKLGRGVSSCASWNPYHGH